MNLTGRPVAQKVPQFVSIKWRRSAEGQDCTLCLPGCQNDTSTTVLCHIRLFSQAGTAQKPHDFIAVYGCAHCHRVFDESPGLWDFEDVLRALIKTLTIHYQEGRIQ